jgi:cell division protease FtsH
MNLNDRKLLSAAKDEKKESQSYEMSFSDDNDNEPDGQDPQGGRNPAEGPKHRGYLSVILLALAFIAIVSLMLYFFAFRSTSTVLSYSDADLAYTVDADRDGTIDQTSDGTPDLSKWDHADGTYALQTVNANGIVKNAGDLSTILLNPSSSRATVSVTVSNTSSQVVYLTGNYIALDTTNNKNVKYSYKATITQSTFNHYVLPLIENVKVIPSGKTAYSLYYNATFYSFSVESTSSLSSWLIPLIFTVLIIAVLIYFVNRMYKSMGAGGSNPMAGFVNNIARKENGNKVRFSDVAGCDEAKAELVEMVDYFHATDKYTRLGAKLPHGVLLVGPPGTGKTLLAKAVAGEASVPFYSISGSDFVEMYVGVGASRVRSLFKTAKANAPCLIFIDEIDAVGRQRGAGLGGGNDEREQTLNELLVEMDGFEDNSGIIVMAATNRADVLDPALTRPGRFDRTITVDLPDKEGRAAILRVHSRNKKLANDVSFDDIASRTVGFSGADLANIMNEAAILAVRANRAVITTADIDEAIDRAIAGPAKKSHLEPHEKEQVAYHEAGHAVIGIFLPYSDVVQKITIIPRGRTGGHVLMTPAQDHFLLTKNQMLARITGYLGGRTSEEIFFGDVSTGASNDIEVATDLARSMVTQYGMSELGPIQYEKPGGSVFLGRDYNSTQANYSTQIAYEIDQAVRAIINQCHEDAKKVLTEHKADVELIAKTLIENETITADQITYLLKNRHLPPVDQHIMEMKNGLRPKNANNIILYPGYEGYYTSIDEILLGKPSRLVIVVATANGAPIPENEFQKACAAGAKDPSHIGMLFVNFAQSSRVSLSIETFAAHLEGYAGVPVLLFKTDDATVTHLQSLYQPKAEPTEAPASSEAPQTDKPQDGPTKPDDPTQK